MYEERMERICALLCLLSGLERREDDPAPLSRTAVRMMLRQGALAGLALRKTGAACDQYYARAQKLLGRASSVSARVETYLSQGYQILLYGEENWPKYLDKLKEDAPLYLFAKGNLALLKGKKAAVAGSRNISEETRRRSNALGRILAQNKLTVVSGGARGVDSAAVFAALEAGGGAVIVPAMSADEFFSSPVYRKACEAGRLLLLCETPPDEPFSARKALTRNHTIYALGDTAMVVASKRLVGGSWSGAVACLKHAYSPLYVLDEDGEEYKGNAALIEKGALRMQVVRENGKEELLLQGMEEAALHKASEDRGGEKHAVNPVRISVRLDQIPREETLRYLGWRGQALDQQTLCQIMKAEGMALDAIEPAAVIAEFTIERNTQLTGASFAAKGEDVSLLLDGCRSAVLLAATLGAQSERLLLRTQAVDKPLAVVLDAMLSAAIEKVCDQACEIIKERAKQRDMETTARFSPGYGDMPIAQTGEILSALSAERTIGLSVSSNGLMMPRKSVCAIIGIGPHVQGRGRSGCAFCKLRDGCKAKGTGRCACAPAEDIDDV